MFDFKRQLHYHIILTQIYRLLLNSIRLMQMKIMSFVKQCNNGVLSGDVLSSSIFCNFHHNTFVQ